jgi:protein tyrosine/serine phosphatase
MDTIFRGRLDTTSGRANAWLDSLLVDHALLRLAWTNFAVISPGKLYRSNHPTPGRLAALVRRRGLRTVVNLRGPCGNGSDALSREAAARLGLDFIDAPLRSRDAPPRDRVLRLVETFRTMRQPALVHCKSGADRASFASALFLMAEGAPTQAALAQFSARFGYLPHARAGILREIFVRYAAEAEGRMPFLAWLREEYDPAALRAGFAAARLSGLVADRILARE